MPEQNKPSQAPEKATRQQREDGPTSRNPRSKKPSYLMTI